VMKEVPVMAKVEIFATPYPSGSDERAWEISTGTRSLSHPSMMQALTQVRLRLTWRRDDACEENAWLDMIVAVLGVEAVCRGALAGVK